MELRQKNILTISDALASNGSPRMRIMTSPPLLKNVAAVAIAIAGPKSKKYEFGNRRT